jgi:hypothetical protein
MSAKEVVIVGDDHRIEVFTDNGLGSVGLMLSVDDGRPAVTVYMRPEKALALARALYDHDGFRP